MKVGDLVRPQKIWIEAIGIVVETGVYTGNRDVKIMWDCGEVFTAISDKLEVISQKNRK